VAHARPACGRGRTARARDGRARGAWPPGGGGALGARRATAGGSGPGLGPQEGAPPWGVARALACRRRAPWPPRHSGPGRGGRGRWTRPGRPPGWPGRGGTGRSDRGGRGGPRAPRRRSAPSRGTPRSGGPAARGRSQRSWRCGRRQPGGGGRRVPGPKAPGGLPGGGAHGRRHGRPPGGGGAWSVGVGAPRQRAPRPSGVPRRRRPWQPWSRWSAAAGPAHGAGRRPKERAGGRRRTSGRGRAGIG